MSIEAIAAVGGQLMTAMPTAMPPTALAPPPDVNALASMPDILNGAQVNAGDGLFDQLTDALGQIDSGMQRNQKAATELALGQTDNLHQVMIDAERTRLQFELAMSMRNRVLEGYQEIMRMQV